MIISIDNLLSNLKIGKSQSYRNLTLYPLINEKPGKIKFISMDSAFNKSLLEIKEIDKGGSVPDLLLINHSKKAVFLWDGEEVIGAKQNRVLNTSMLINKKSEAVIPVSCVEQGRWRYNSKTFHKSEAAMPNRMRRNKMKSVEESLKNAKGYMSDQNKVWHDIDKLSMAASVESPTSAMNDVFKSKKEDLDGFIRNIPIQEDQRGFIAAIDGKIVGLDYVSRRKVFKKLYKKFLKSYATDAMINYDEKQSIEVDTISNPEDFINELIDMKASKFKSVGLGNDYRFEKKGLSANGLVYRKNVIAFSAGWDN